MKETILLLTLLLIAGEELQSQSWQWARRTGGSFGVSADIPNESVRDVQTDAQGNVYICGRVGLGANFQGTPMTTYSPNGYTLFLAKLDCNGNLLWLRTAGGGLALNEANSLVLDGLGHIYLTGKINGSTIQPITFMDSTIAENTSDLFLAKFDTAGNFKWLQWAAKGSAQLFSFGLKVRIDPQGRINIMGIAPVAGLLFPGFNIPHSTFIASFNSSGIMIGYTMLSTISLYKSILDYAIHPVTGDQYVTGYFSSDSLVIGNGDTVLYNTSNTVGANLFFAKFDSSGNFKYVIHAGDTSASQVQGTGIHFFQNNNLALCGDISPGAVLGGFSFNNSLSTTVGRNVPFVACISPQGQVLWAVNSENQYVSSSTGGINVLPNGDAYFSGFFGGNANFGSSSYSSIGSRDIFLAKVLPSGIIASAVKIDGTGSKEEPLCITSDSSGNVYIGGGFDGTMTVNGVNYSNAGGQTDGFIVKYGFNCTTGIEEETAAAQQQDGLLIYPNPAANIIYIGNPTGEIEKAELYNLLGEKVISQRANRSASRISINISLLPSGIYLVAVHKTNGERMAVKVMVQREE